MTPTRTEFQVVPTGAEWEIRQDGIVMLTVQTKQVAVDEAVVQAVLAKPSHVTVHTLDGGIEEEADFGDLPSKPKERSRRRRTTSAKTDAQVQRELDESETPGDQSMSAQDQAEAS